MTKLARTDYIYSDSEPSEGGLGAGVQVPVNCGLQPALGLGPSKKIYSMYYLIEINLYLLF